MQKKILTISIASYNVEKFIIETLESFVIPEIMNELEVIIVNDGSKDNTSNLAHKFAEQYPDTFVVIDKQNGGYGSTINESTKIARGKYFKTVDGDDWVDKKGLINLIRYLERIDDDIVITNYCRVNNKNQKVKLITFDCRQYKVSYRFDETYNNQKLFMQAISIKTIILKQIDLCITEHCFYTDIEYILTPIPYIETISYLNECVYMYRVAVNEQSMSVAGKRKHIDEQLEVLKKMLIYYAMVKEGLGTGKKRFFVTILSEMYKSHVTAILSLDISSIARKRLLDIEKFLNNKAPDIYLETNKYKTISMLRKTNYLLYQYGSIIYKYYQKVLSFIGR